MNIIILITAANSREARKLAEGLLKNKLAACVNIVPGIRSYFRWKGKIDRTAESLLLVKTKKSKFKKVAGLVKSLHSYEVPEIIAVPVVSGYAPYLRWIDASVR